MSPAGGAPAMVCGIFLCQTLGSIVPTNHDLISIAYLSIFAHHVYPFVVTVYPSCDGRVSCPEEGRGELLTNGFLNMTMSLTAQQIILLLILTTYLLISPDLSLIERPWDVVEREFVL